MGRRRSARLVTEQGDAERRFACSRAGQKPWKGRVDKCRLAAPAHIGAERVMTTSRPGAPNRHPKDLTRKLTELAPSPLGGGVRPVRQSMQYTTSQGAEWDHRRVAIAQEAGTIPPKRSAPEAFPRPTTAAIRPTPTRRRADEARRPLPEPEGNCATSPSRPLDGQCDASYWLRTSAGIRPRCGTSIPCSRAHSRTAFASPAPRLARGAEAEEEFPRPQRVAFCR